MLYVCCLCNPVIRVAAGEDRWLCTLMLQQGKRVEYAAAADALTFCPDDFGEFYKQRRRWTPSTMANILDLLLDWRHVTKRNGSISLLFIAYQVCRTGRRGNSSQSGLEILGHVGNTWFCFRPCLILSHLLSLPKREREREKWRG